MAEVPPLIVEHRKEDVRPNRFVPDTRLVVTGALRTSGLLASLSDREARTLLAVLTFLTKDGRFTGTVGEIARALGISEKFARERLCSLMALSFRGKPVLIEVPREQSSPFYVPGPQVARHVQEEPAESQPVSLPIPAVGRETLVALNREKYARPREEVERIVAAQMGHDPLESEGSPEGEAFRRLLGVGVAREEATRLLASFPLEEIARQLDWLPYRQARVPARFLVAAIENAYDPPPGLEHPVAVPE